MLAGRKLLEALIVYSKIQVGPLKPTMVLGAANEETKEERDTNYTKIQINDIERELTTNKKLIEMTKGDEDGDEASGSDSEPSEDNLSEEEMAKIIPVKRKETASPNKVKEKKKD